MRNYKKYRPFVITLFESFLAGKIEKRELVFELKQIDKELGKNPKTLKGLWFKFFEGDTLATTITALNGYADGVYLKELMQIAIDNPKGLQIYYS